MNAKLAILLSGILVISSFGLSTLPGDAAPKKTASAKPKPLPTILTGFPTNLSLTVLRCVRAHVPEFGTNNVVVIQYRLRKEGPNTGDVKYFGDARFVALDIKTRDPALASAYEPIRGANLGERTYSDDVDTANWKVGQTGDGYAWFKIPERVTSLDVFFPKTSPIRIPIEVPKG